MKTRMRGIKGMLGAAIVFCLVLGLSQVAHAVPKGIDPEDHSHCIIKNNLWDNNTGDKGISLRTAIDHANNPDKHDSCNRLIEILPGQQVQMTSPLVILRDGLTIDGSPAGAGSSERATLDVKKIDAFKKTDGESGNGCAIWIAANDVTIKNVKLSGNTGDNYAGICFAGTDNIINNVKVSGGTTGIIFVENSAGNRVLPNVKVSANSGFAIEDRSTGDMANNVVMNNYKSVKKGAYKEKVDGDGFVDWVHQLPDTDPDADDSPYFSLNQLIDLTLDMFVDEPNGTTPLEISLSGGDGLLKSQRAVMPLITEIDWIADKKVEIRGIFKKVTLDENAEQTSIPKQDCNGIPDGGVERLALFSVQASGMEYIATVGMALDFGVDVEEGTFKFYLNGNKNAEFASISDFILVPVSKQWGLVGRASEYKMLADLETDCIEGTGPSGSGNNGGDGTEHSIQGYSSKAECNEDNAFIPGSVDTTKDSDLDGIPDYIEMAVQWKPGINAWVFDPLSDDESPEDQKDGGGSNCECDDSKLTCWFKMDSDTDGIPDNLDGGGYDWSKFSDYDGTEPVADRTVDPKNTDGEYTYVGAVNDNTPDVKDRDSDNDGERDGAEDRSMYWNKNMKGIFVKYDMTGMVPYPNNTNPVECDLSVYGSLAEEVGIYWGIFKVGTGISVPEEYSMWDNFTLEEGQDFKIMACVNKSVREDTNFNGKYDQEVGETDYQSVDTDNDCVCDFEAVGCRQIDEEPTSYWGMSCSAKHSGESVMDNTLWLNDGCPEKPHEDNVCGPDCIPGKVIKYIQWSAPEWLNDAQDALKDDDPANSVPDLFEQTYEETDPDTGVTLTKPDLLIIGAVCSDFDGDGIPDCVEDMEGDCDNAPSKPRLNPFWRDSDGDGLVDGMAMGNMKADVCPFTPPYTGQSDEFTAISPHYSCDPRLQVYAHSQVPSILACYLDRDGDGASDCEEDMNMDGQPALPVTGLEGIALSESDPLDQDTDDDGLDDYTEKIKGWPYKTNPALADTDADGLLDPEEDRNGDGVIDITMLEGQGCETALEGQYDTNPRMADTDEDGLYDFQELFPAVMDPDVFRNEILNMETWADGGIPHASSPLAKDSDGDGLKDSEEYNGEFITYFDSNPCMIDSDGDTRHDNDELPGCRLNPRENCVGSEDASTAAGLDWDGDGLTNAKEFMLGTDPNYEDSDGDGVWDGVEDANQNGIYEPSLGESNPLGTDNDGDGIPDGYDTDKDGLNDGLELRYGLDPTNIDSDSDCISDGVEDANQNGQYDMGVETDARSSDTDGDGLPDGWVATSGMGEDVNCNGIRDQGADGSYTETDPRNPDSDMDGIDDFTEMWHDGVFNLNNIDRATTGRSSCSLFAGAAQAPSGMMLLIGLALGLARVIRRKDETPA